MSTVPPYDPVSPPVGPIPTLPGPPPVQNPPPTSERARFPIDHPLWLICKALVLILAAVLFAYTNASQFDETEVKFLLELALVLFGGTFLEALLRKKHTTP